MSCTSMPPPSVLLYVLDRFDNHAIVDVSRANFIQGASEAKDRFVFFGRCAGGCLGLFFALQGGLTPPTFLSLLLALRHVGVRVGV